jgi:hypothetical protein
MFAGLGSALEMPGMARLSSRIRARFRALVTFMQSK